MSAGKALYTAQTELGGHVVSSNPVAIHVSHRMRRAAEACARACSGVRHLRSHLHVRGG